MIESIEGVAPTIADRAFVHPSAVVIGQVSLGEGASVWPNATLRGDEGTITVGAWTNIQDGCTLHMTGGQTNTVVGARCTVGHNAILHGCTVGNDVLVGMGSLVMDLVVIGDGCYIGAGTMIPPRKVIPPGMLVYGNPYRIVRPCGAKETEWIAYAWEHYFQNAQKYASR